MNIFNRYFLTFSDKEVFLINANNKHDARLRLNLIQNRDVEPLEVSSINYDDGIIYVTIKVDRKLKLED